MRKAMQYASIREPRWANAERTKIVCRVKFDDLKNEVGFLADPNDIEPHGREIYSRCVAEEFGRVQEYAPNPQSAPLPVERIQAEVPDYLEGWPEIQEFLTQANTENASGTPRGIILVWSSMIEELLGRLLEAFLIDHSLSREMIWSDSHSSLGTFSGRSNCCFALGLISRRELNTCNQVRTVRNVASHEWNLDLNDATFSKRALPALKRLYEADHAQIYNWKEDDLAFLIVRFYAGSCALLTMRLAERRARILKERRIERGK